MSEDRRRHGTGDDRHHRATWILTMIFCTAVVVSVIHYTDNYFNYHDYPRSATLPNPSATAVWVGWLAFTATGLAGYLWFRRIPSTGALILLALYSGSGVVGIGHYVVPGATGMPWWRQAHIVADITSGFAMLAFVLWARTYLHDLVYRPDGFHAVSGSGPDKD